MKETKIEYMKRRLDEFRIMKPEKTLPLQRDFPNCGKYEKCCTKDEKFWDKVEVQQNDGHLTEEKTMKGKTETEHELILHNVNGYKIDKKRDKIYDTPKGFEEIHLPEGYENN